MTHFLPDLQKMASARQWEKIGTHPHRGIDVPLSSLVSEKSCGIGEFFDLLPLIDWCSQLQIDTIQLLPLNDSAFDPSPYNAISSCALHPIYLSLEALPNVHLHKDLLAEISRIQRFNECPSVPFQAILLEKEKFFSSYFAKEGHSFLFSPAFLQFIEENPWLRAYALFKVLKEKSHQAHSSLWQESWKNLSSEAFDALFQTFEDPCIFHIVLQFLCFSQLKAVQEKAHKKNIHLKGDLPILISPDSADVWSSPHLFDQTLSIGAPPDFYSSEGQYWGFPMPNWGAMRETGFSWWKERLKYAENFYDIYRIDHAVGLFRLWAIPVGRPSREGAFLPSEEILWEPLGRELLQVFLSDSSMLPIAEDLGCVPDFVRSVLKEMGICGTKVVRWERDHSGSFLDPREFDPISLTCVSTHDSLTLDLWWKEEADSAKAFAAQKGWNYGPALSIDQRREILKDSLTSGSLFRINLFLEYLALVEDLVWPDPKQERINVPGTLLPSNWTYKLRKPLEKTLAHPQLLQEMKELFL